MPDFLDTRVRVQAAVPDVRNHLKFKILISDSYLSASQNETKEGKQTGDGAGKCFPHYRIQYNMFSVHVQNFQKFTFGQI
jgi:hypothetical protein